jgi:hypothetical protein
LIAFAVGKILLFFVDIISQVSFSFRRQLYCKRQTNKKTFRRMTIYQIAFLGNSIFNNKSLFNNDNFKAISENRISYILFFITKGISDAVFFLTDFFLRNIQSLRLLSILAKKLI